MTTLDDYLDEPRTHGKLVLALQRIISAEFTNADWQEIGYSSGQHEYIQHHDRLLRSLHFGDDDYGACVFQCLEYFARHQRHAIELLINHPKLRSQLIREVPDIIGFVHVDVERVHSEALPDIAPGDVVLRALADAEHLLLTSGPVSAVDRLHTALHGYFRMLCTSMGISVADDASMTALFKALRADHPALSFMGPHDKEMVRVLNGFANAIDALNSLRNNGSIAHPSKNLLGEPEALLAVNATRTIFNYIRAKVGQ
ncbi:hypothetical protein GTP44_26405 [Duganella sp. FT50W]|uniref:Abortive infection protein-like C-terminal domain-containing protein n=1 Tax=Duganella lactea TaxID=2692173 RepID=A0A6L8MTM7_9BURK|nr:abortive infection family protein [Duganella lactea]MYM85451.1 hypothetical protein [Duganella lactea]